MMIKEPNNLHLMQHLIWENPGAENSRDSVSVGSGKNWTGRRNRIGVGNTSLWEGVRGPDWGQGTEMPVSTSREPRASGEEKCCSMPSSVNVTCIAFPSRPLVGSDLHKAMLTPPHGCRTQHSVDGSQLGVGAAPSGPAVPLRGLGGERMKIVQ